MFVLLLLYKYLFASFSGDLFLFYHQRESWYIVIVILLAPREGYVLQRGRQVVNYSRATKFLASGRNAAAHKLG